MKIVVFPGVGFNTATATYTDFSQSLKNGLSCDVEFFYWKHNWPIPDVTLPIVSFRKWLFEVILDFQQVVRHAYEMEVPEADYYIGHSAGSILALAQKNSPCVIFGSPACLVECIHNPPGDNQLNNALRTDRKILNIINKYDPVAYYLTWLNVENFVFMNSWYTLNAYNPVECHNGYWESKVTRNKIIETIKIWQEKNT